MDAKLKEDWVKALRSGEYRQAQMALRDHGAFCCLGVLCKVAKIPISRDGTQVSRQRDYHPIAELIGSHEAMRSLMGRNDSGSPFPEIADYIEANL